MEVKAGDIALQKSAISKNAILGIVLVSYLMGVFDVSIMITALPKIQADFGVSPSASTWVQTAYTLAYGGFILLGARAGDFVGRRKIFLIGMGIFTAASVLISVSSSMSALVASRALQGLGAAILTPAALALLTATFPQGPERSRVVSYYGAMAGLGTSLGLVLGGFLADAFSWRIGFFINLPIGIALIGLALRHVRETPLIPAKIDVLGAIMSTAGAACLVFGVESASHGGWARLGVLMPIGLGTILLIAFIAWQRRVPNPILPLRMLAHRARLGGYLGRGLFVAGMMGFWFFMSMFLQKASGRGAFETGIAFLPTTLVGFVSAMAASRAAPRFGNGPVAAFGLIGALIGVLWLSWLLPSAEGLVVPMMLVGLGQGFALGPLTGAAMVDVRPEEAGIGSGLINVAQQMGASFGISVLAVVYSATEGGIGRQTAHSMTAAAVLFGLALIAVAALVLPWMPVHTAFSNFKARMLGMARVECPPERPCER